MGTRYCARRGVTISNRDQLVNDLNWGQRRVRGCSGRSRESGSFHKEYNPAFVACNTSAISNETPEAAGFNAWLNYLNANPGDFRTMVNGFLNSLEHRSRFGRS